MKTFSSTLTNLARQYGVHRKTLKKMLNDYPQVQLSATRRTLTPKEVEQNYDCLGKPPEFQ